MGQRVVYYIEQIVSGTASTLAVGISTKARIMNLLFVLSVLCSFFVCFYALECYNDYARDGITEYKDKTTCEVCGAYNSIFQGLQWYSSDCHPDEILAQKDFWCG